MFGFALSVMPAYFLTWTWPQPDELIIGDRAAYYLREGNHGAEPGDWLALVKFLEGRATA